MDIPKRNLERLKGKTVTIDGPAGSGKSTTARLLATGLGYRYLDTGAMYRALTHFARGLGVDASDAVKLTKLAKTLPIEFIQEQDVQHVLINGVDVTDEIRSPEVTAMVSEVSAHAGVREAMVAIQRKLGAKGSVVAEGRDCATVVFPKADFKFYMDASVEARAQRRLLDLMKMGKTLPLEEVKASIERRDNYDSNRKHSPLRKAKNAYVVDTTNLTIEEQVEHIMSLITSLAR